MFSREHIDERRIKRFGETGVRDRGRKASAGQVFRRLEAFRQTRAKRKQGDAGGLRRIRPRPISKGSPRSGKSTPVPSPRG